MARERERKGIDMARVEKAMTIAAIVSPFLAYALMVWGQRVRVDATEDAGVEAGSVEAGKVPSR